MIVQQSPGNLQSCRDTQVWRYLPETFTLQSSSVPLKSPSITIAALGKFSLPEASCGISLPYMLALSRITIKFKCPSYPSTLVDFPKTPLHVLPVSNRHLKT